MLLLQARAAELQSRLDIAQADARAAAAALGAAQEHVRNLEEVRDDLQRQKALAEEQAQRLRGELANSKVGACLRSHLLLSHACMVNAHFDRSVSTAVCPAQNYGQQVSPPRTERF